MKNRWSMKRLELRLVLFGNTKIPLQSLDREERIRRVFRRNKDFETLMHKTVIFFHVDSLLVLRQGPLPDREKRTTSRTKPTDPCRAMLLFHVLLGEPFDSDRRTVDKPLLYPLQDFRTSTVGFLFLVSRLTLSYTSRRHPCLRHPIPFSYPDEN